MTIFEFVEQLCDIIGGEDAYYRFEKEELIKMCQEMSTSHEEYQNMLDCKDAAEVHELMNPAVCDVWLLLTGDTTAPNNPSTRNMYASYKQQKNALNN